MNNSCSNPPSWHPSFTPLPVLFVGLRVFVTSCLCLFFLLANSAVLRAAAPDIELAPAQELHIRGGLPNFFARLHAGQEVRVAYLGGSITAAPGWRVQSLQWLQKRYPTAKISEIHAAIGGTGSDLGAFRVGEHVIAHQPHLVFVEFAVNDGGAAPDQIIRSMEGIVRQIWVANPATDICFVYTMVEGMAPTVAEGHFPRSASADELVAEHYNIPTIHFGLEVTKLQKEGKLVFTANTPEQRQAAAGKIIFTNDHTHPTIPAGHQIYMDVLARCLPEIEHLAAAAPHTLPAPLTPDNYEQAKLLEPTPAMFSGDWTQLDPKTDSLAKNFAQYMPAIHLATKPGAALTVHFQGTSIGLFDIRGPFSGQWRITVDDKPPTTINRFDGYCSYSRQSFFLLPALPPGEHTARFVLAAEPADKPAILKAHHDSANVRDYEAHPDKYKDSTVNVGKIMLLGQLLPD